MHNSFYGEVSTLRKLGPSILSFIKLILGSAAGIYIAFMNGGLLTGLLMADGAIVLDYADGDLARSRRYGYLHKYGTAINNVTELWQVAFVGSLWIRDLMPFWYVMTALLVMIVFAAILNICSAKNVVYDAPIMKALRYVLWSNSMGAMAYSHIVMLETRWPGNAIPVVILGAIVLCGISMKRIRSNLRGDLERMNDNPYLSLKESQWL